MKRTAQEPLTAAEKREAWARWKRGETQVGIAKVLRISSTGIRRLLVPTGGIPPPARARNPRSLSLAEREEISRGVCAGSSATQIARQLGRAPSTVCREINRNGGRETYRATSADKRAWAQAKRPKECKLAAEGRLRQQVAWKLSLDWSPEQIAEWLKRAFPNDERMQVSHETIYRSLFIQARGTLKKELMRHLRTKRTIRHSRHATISGQCRGKIREAVSISERPAEVEDRAVPGHWEGDLIAGTNNSHIATLVERHSRFVMLVKVKSKDTDTVVAALTKKIGKLPAELRRSLTWDRGLEMAHHKEFTVATDVQVYFCDPQSPWQRGSNENTNGLLRQYFPKKTDLSVHPQSKLNAVAKRLNQRPRKTLKFKTPAEILESTLR